MRTFLIYTALRLAIVAGCFGVLYLVFTLVAGMAPVLPLLGMAVLFGSGISFFVLRRRGAEAGQALVSGVKGARTRLDSAASREDADDEPESEVDQVAAEADVEADPARSGRSS